MEVLQTNATIVNLKEHEVIVRMHGETLASRTSAIPSYYAYLFGIRLDRLNLMKIYLEGQYVFVRRKYTHCEVHYGWSKFDPVQRYSQLILYCQGHNIERAVAAELESRHNLLLDEREEEHSLNHKKTIVTKATIINLGQHTGQLLHESRHLSFTSKQFFVHGYCVGDLDMTRLWNRPFKVHIRLINDLLDAVWIGSLKKSRDLLRAWIQKNVQEQENRICMERHWHVNVGTRTVPEPQGSVSIEVQNEPEFSEEFGTLWTPIAPEEDETSCNKQIHHIIGATETIELVSLDSRDDGGTKVSYDAFHEVSEESVAGKNSLSHECIDVPQSLKQHLTRFLCERRLVSCDEEGAEAAAAFVDDWTYCFWDNWEFKPGKEEDGGLFRTELECTSMGDWLETKYLKRDASTMTSNTEEF